MRTSSLTGISGLLLGVVACAGDAESARGSPTGTTLVPRTGLDAAGYEVIDEVCGNVSDPDYLARFETPMFRSVSVVDGIAYLVDGSLLWAVNIADPAQPERLSLTRLPGHALSIAAGDGAMLWIAAGEAGLLGVDVSDPVAPELSVEASFGERTLDVEWREGRGYLALGAEGIKSFVLDAQGTPELEHEIATDAFSVEIEVTSSRIFAAACDQVLGYELVAGEPPRAQSPRDVPSGNGRAVTATESAVYVAGGDALYAYGIEGGGTLRPLGRYADPSVPGFYVNDIVVSGDTGFIAAGDESVRVVDLGAIAAWSAGASELPEPAEPELDDAFELTLPTVRIEYGDPIAVGLHGDALLVLGNFRWVGERLLRILDAASPEALPELGRYAQPDRYSSVERGELELWLQEQGGATLELDADLRIVREWGLADDGRARRFGEVFVHVTSEGWLYCAEGGVGTLLHGGAGGGWAASSERLVVGTPGDNALVSYPLVNGCPDVGSPFAVDLGLVGFARLGTSEGRLLAYDWVLGTLHVFDDASGRTEPRSYNVGACENYDWADTFSGASEVRARFVATPGGFGLLCPSDEDGASTLRVFRWDASGAPVERAPFPLPPNLYVDVVPAGGGWALAAFDNGRYESELILLDAAGQITARVSYDGHAAGLAELTSELYVFDDDRGVLRYDGASGSLLPMELVAAAEGATP